MSIEMLLLIAAGAIIIILAAYASVLWSKVYRQRRQQSLALADQAAADDAKLEYVHSSMLILARAMLQGQVSETEAAIRISTLARALPANGNEQQFDAFEQLAAETAHIPTHQRWRELKLAQQKRFDKQREQIEAKHHDAVTAAARHLLAQAPLSLDG